MASVRRYTRSEFLLFIHSIGFHPGLDSGTAEHLRFSISSRRIPSAGWLAVLKCTPPIVTPVPSLFNNVVRHLCAKMSDLFVMLESPICVQACMIHDPYASVYT